MILVPEARATQPDYFVWAEQSTKKVMKHDLPKLLSPEGISIKGAKNEYEAFQLVVTSYTRDIPSVNITVSDFVGPKGKIIKKENISLFLEHYVYVAKPSDRIGMPDYYPDPLPLFKPFAVKAYENQPTWFNVYIPKDATAGNYLGTITVSPEGSAPIQIPLKLTVWDFALTDESHQETMFSGGGRTQEERASWYWFLVERRITPGFVPVPLTDPRAAKFIEDPRVTTFVIPYNDTLEVLRKTIELVKANNWLKKGFFYAFDEPSSADYPNITKIIRNIREIEPTARVIGTMLNKVPDPALYGLINLWCPDLRPINEQEENGYFLRDRQKLGEGAWWYTCTIPKNPYPTYLLDDEAICPRILNWMQWLYHIEGSLYWATGNWGELGNPWVDPLTYPFGWANGDGCLVYPGDKVGVLGLVSCIRLELIRQGNEDYEYLWLLQDKVKSVMKALGIKPDQFDPHSRGEDFCRAMIEDLNHFDRDPEKLYQMREKLAEEILTIEAHPIILVKMEPADNQKVFFTGDAMVKGIVESGTKVTVNGILQTVTGNTFQTTVALKRGENRIEIVAQVTDKVKNLIRTVIVKEDPLLTEFAEAIKEMEAEGIPVIQSKKLLQKIWDSETYTPSTQEQVKQEIESLRKQLASLLLERTKPSLTFQSAAFQKLFHRAESFLTAKNYPVAINVLRQVQQIKREGIYEDCRVVSLVYQGQQCFSLTNGVLNIVVSRNGGKILKFAVEGTPVIQQQDLVRTFSYAEWRTPLGGYEDAYERDDAERLDYFSMTDWDLQVVEDTPQSVAIKAEVYVREPKRCFRLEREMRLQKDDTGLQIKYIITNLGDEELIYKWHSWVRPAIGFKGQGEGGDPEGDVFILPLKETYKYPLFDSKRYPYQRFNGYFQLIADYAGVFDPSEEVAFMQKFDPKIKRLFISYDTRKASHGYAIIPILPDTLLGKGETLTFTNYLVGLSKIKNQAEAVERIKSY